MAKVTLNNICKEYSNGIKVVDNFNIDIDDNEFIVLLGPSGCGKSTTLRMIAGLENITEGELYIDNKLVNDVEPKDRDIAMVFQNYALYPHMTVYDNMAFSLKLRKVPKEEIKKRVLEVSSILGIEELLHRRPNQLSGGQMQRVALGRSIVRNPKIFLMDEPLSNLDAKLRYKSRIEIIKLYKKLGGTFIYVTHDQVEAMTMGSRIVIMKDGVIRQIASPKDIYEKPSDTFVASFIGTPPMNLIKGSIKEDDNNHYFIFKENKIKLSNSKIKILKKNGYIEKEIILGIRPEDVTITNSIDDVKNILISKIDVEEVIGRDSILYLNISGESVIAKVDSKDKNYEKTVEVKFDEESIYFFDIETKKRIY